MASELLLDLPPDWWEPPRRMTEAEYLLLEEASATQHEFDSGWMYPRFYPPGSHWAMSGGTVAHTRICRELGRLVANHLLDGLCESYAVDLLVAIDPGRDYYPDLVVVCGDQPAGGERRLYDATLVVEVLSRSTVRMDRGRKFRAYQELESLEEYVLVDSRRRHVEVFRRDANWERAIAATDGDVTLTSIGLSLDLDALYDRARLAREARLITGGEPTHTTHGRQPATRPAVSVTSTVIPAGRIRGHSTSVGMAPARCPVPEAY